MGGPGEVVHLRVVQGPMVQVEDHQRYGRAQGDAPLRAAVDGDLVRLVAGRGQRRLPRPSPRQLNLHVPLNKPKPWRASVDDHSHAFAVAFAKRRDSKHASKRAHLDSS